MNINNVINNRNGLLASFNAVPACQTGDGESDWFPAVDLTETGQEYVFDVDLPGLKPQEVQVRVQADELTITGQRVRNHQRGKHVRVERPSGAFVRRLPLPPDAQGDIHATFCDGVLELRVPKARPAHESAEAQAEALEPQKAAA